MKNRQKPKKGKRNWLHKVTLRVNKLSYHLAVSVVFDGDKRKLGNIYPRSLTRESINHFRITSSSAPPPCYHFGGYAIKLGHKLSNYFIYLS